MTTQILVGDVRNTLASVRTGSVHCVVTSPPYWALRDYGVAGQLGLEATPEEFVANMVEVFRDVRRVLRDDGTLWLNLGDTFIGQSSSRRGVGSTLKPKDLAGIPWMVAKALQAPYYTGSIKDERDRIWLAAMLDAEGCIFIHKRKAGQSNGNGYERKSDSFAPGVEIANTSRAVIDRVARLVGKGSICSQTPEQSPGRKQTIYRWNLRTIECREFLREVYPHLVAKQQQARIAIGCPSSGERAAASHAALIGLHHGVATDVDFAPPATLFEPGWYLRSDIIWSKCNPMPEPVRDRPVRSHEFVFLLAKSPRYFYDADAVREPHAAKTLASFGAGGSHGRAFGKDGQQDATGMVASGNFGASAGEASQTRVVDPRGRHRRDVWTVGPKPYHGAHFAVFPPALVAPCILAGTSAHGACATCGAPWARSVDRIPVGGRDDTGRTKSLRGQRMGKAAPPEKGWASDRVTTGWHPTCACPERTVVPCTVMDPFGGSGTTAVVSEAHGRDAILGELNAGYVPLIHERLAAGLKGPKRPRRMPVTASVAANDNATSNQETA
jgi:DNA modification methylase